MRKMMIVLSLVGVVCLVGVTPSLAGKYNEAPMLKELVKAGKLPPVEERLPKEPFVVGPGVLMPRDELDFEIGQYGGTMRLVRIQPDWDWATFIQCREPLLDAPSLTTGDIRGNVLKDYSVSQDGKVFTFYMREGLKWSDGVPVTTEDVLFAYEDVLMNEKLTPAFPTWLRSGNRGDGEPLKLEVVDKYTFRVSFAEPYGGFPTQLAINGWRRYDDLLKPKHHLKQYHIRYTPLEKLEPLIKEAALAKGEWWTLFTQKDILTSELSQPGAIGFPVLFPWMLVSETPTTTIYERNPYYFKVDSEGNQLPYIDKLRTELVADAKTVPMKIIAGEVDHSYEYGTLMDLPLYKENEEKAGYRVILFDMHRTMADIWLNHTHPDPAWRQVVRDVRFRKALNMGINYEEIVDAVYLGFASPPKSVPSVYDPVKANQLLDEMGLDKRDADGWRLGPDGKRFVIPIEFTLFFSELGATAELVAEYWNALGIKTTVKTIEQGLRMKRQQANDLKATVIWGLRRGLWWALWESDPYSPWGPQWPLWQKWFVTDGKKGEEPPEDVKRFGSLSAQLYVVPPGERQEVYDEFLRLLYENIYWFITAEDVKYVVTVSKNMGNVAHKGYGIGAHFSAEQYFFRQ